MESHPPTHTNWPQRNTFHWISPPHMQPGHEEIFSIESRPHACNCSINVSGKGNVCYRFSNGCTGSNPLGTVSIPDQEQQAEVDAREPAS